MNEPDGFEQENIEISREQAFREATAARNAMFSESFGNGDNAVFGYKPGSETTPQSSPKATKRMEMMEKLGGIIAEAIGKQLAALPAAIADAMQSGSRGEQFEKAQDSLGLRSGGVQKQEPVVPVLVRSQDGGDGIRTESRTDNQPALRQFSPRTGPVPPASDVRPKELADYPVDMLPKAPMRIGRDIPMRSLDDTPQVPAGIDPVSHASTSPRPMAGPTVPPATPRASTQQNYEIPQFVPSAYHSPAADPQGNPRVDNPGGQMGEMTELAREFAESNMAYHDAMRMFVGLMLESMRQLTEEIYQANMALDRQERAT